MTMHKVRTSTKVESWYALGKIQYNTRKVAASTRCSMTSGLASVRNRPWRHIAQTAAATSAYIITRLGRPSKRSNSQFRRCSLSYTVPQ